MKAILLFLVISPFFLNAQTTSIPDAIFEQALIDRGWDDEIDGEVLTESIDTVLTLNLAFEGISNLAGIEGFTALQSLVLFENYLDELDLSSNLALVFLNCEENLITNLNVTENVNLERIWASDNNLTSVDLSGNPAVYELLIESNFLTALDLSNNPLLTIVNCATNNLTELNLSDAPGLLYLGCHTNDLSELDLSNNLALRQLVCYQNNLTGLDLSQQSDLDGLLCGTNNLTFLDIRNGNNSNMGEGHFSAFANPDLFCIQVDDETYAIDTWTPAVDDHSVFNEICGVSISKDVLEVLVNVYPIPAEDFINISVNQKNVNYKLLDLSGKIMHAGKLVTGNNRIDVKGFSKGIYFLKIDSNTYHATHKTIIK